MSRWLAPPDIGEPFDVEAFTSFTLPDDQNAFIFYRRAIERYIDEDAIFPSGVPLKHQDFSDSLEAAEQGGWEHAVPWVRRWVALNAPALKEFERGAELADSLQFPLAEANELSIDWGKLRACSRAELLDGMRLSSAQRPAEAWHCFRSLLGASRHLARHAGSIGTLFGLAVADEAVLGGVHWSAQKSVGAQDLGKAICDVLSIEDMRTPASDAIKLEYVALRDNCNKGIVFGTAQPFWVRSTGYPAQLGRLSRLVVANLLTQADRPRYRRGPVHPGSLRLFDFDPASAPDPQLRPPEEIEAAASTSIESFARALRWLAPDAASQIEAVDPQLHLGNLSHILQWVDVAQARRGGLLLALALQLHYREHGEFPASLDELVKNGYLKSIPADPFGKGEAFHYRLNGAPSRDAVLWSVYTDGIDNGGADVHGGKGDWAIHVRVPGT
ncbi:MAG TPA: hypothetical protein VFG04_30640, partial [Planctomycetaceae bacterium]|nr:hypothetical protein [Planctomycetaceae bacterium]